LTTTDAQHEALSVRGLQVFLQKVDAHANLLGSVDRRLGIQVVDDARLQRSHMFNLTPTSLDRITQLS